METDNNLVENAIRPLALGRKYYLFARPHDAASGSRHFYLTLDSLDLLVRNAD